MKAHIPSSLKAEHEELHTRLTQTIKLGGTTGAAAIKVADLLHPHFTKEEQYALPPLGLLEPLAAGNTPDNAEEVVAEINQFKVELPEMLLEHEKIVAALKSLEDEARKENHPQVKVFAQKLILHALTEEQVMYPAAILVGEVLSERLKIRSKVF